MTNAEVLQIAKIGAFAVPAASAIIVAIIKLSPAWLTARTAAKLASDDEARKQRDEIRTEKKAVEAERDALKAESRLLEQEADYYKEQFSLLREQIVNDRAICQAKGNPCGQAFEPIPLRPFVRPVLVEKKETP